MPSLPKPSAKVSDAQAEAMQLLAQGRTIVEVAEETGRHRNTIRSWKNHGETGKYFDSLLRARMSELLPGVLNRMVERTEDPTAPLIGLAKVFESLADRSGHPAEKHAGEQDAPTQIGISINLGDEPDTSDPRDAKIAELEATVSMLLNGAKQAGAEGNPAIIEATAKEIDNG